MKNKRFFSIVLFLTMMLFVAVNVDARPGGGHSYGNSSGSHSYSHSNSRHSSYSSSSSSSADGDFSLDDLEEFGKFWAYVIMWGVGFIALYLVVAIPIFVVEETIFKNFEISMKILKILTIGAAIFAVGCTIAPFIGLLGAARAGFFSALPFSLLMTKKAVTKNYMERFFSPLYKKQDKLAQVEQTIAEIQKQDINFSQPAFLDFASSLYIKFYKYKADTSKFTAMMSPFVADNILQEWLADTYTYVKEIVIGSISVVPGKEINPQKINVKIKSNYTAVLEDKYTYRFYVTEVWTFERRTQLSPEPEKMHDLQCPVCGAPADFNDAGVCNHCGSNIIKGEQQWYLSYIDVANRTKERANTGLATYSQDVGYDAFTVVAKDIDEKIKHFADKYSVNWDEYFEKFKENKLQPVFNKIYDAWEEMDWLKARHLMSDRLWESWNFWIETYKYYGLKNVLENPVIDKVELANVNIDKFYDSITVRIFVSLKDYTIRTDTGEFFGGSKKIKKFSEYWTFVRRCGVEDKYEISQCPNCGAPADKIGQSGVCEYCGVKISTGDFGWVLFRVVQDEEYPG